VTTPGQNAQGAKNHLLNRFKRSWNTDNVLVMSETTAMEMGQFVNKDGLLEAMRPHHDDTVMAAAFFIEAVYDQTSDVVPTEVRVTPEMVGLLEDDDFWADGPEKVDVKEYRRQVLERMGIYTDKTAHTRQPLSRWL
jgi:hypothetical protein